MLWHIYVLAVGINQRGVKAVAFWPVTQTLIGQNMLNKSQLHYGAYEICAINCEKRLINY